MACYYLQQVPCLDVPGIDLVGVEGARKNHLSRVIQLETYELATLVRSKHSEFFLLEDIIGIESAIETAGEEGV